MKRRIRCGGKPMTAIVLAGGRGQRMETDKAGLPVGGRTLLEHVLAQIEPLFDEIIVSISKGQGRKRKPAGTGRKSQPDEGYSGPKLVEDEVRGQGPIGGILAGLRAARNDACAVVACDMPDIPIPLLRSLARAARDAEIAVPVDPAGHYEPLFAIYKRSVAGAIEALLARGERSLLPLYNVCRTAVMPLGEKLRLRNLNTREDYEAYIRSIAGRRAGQSGSRRGRHGKRPSKNKT